MRSRAGFGVLWGKVPWATQVADAMITWPVFLSIATTDQVANAEDSTSNKRTNASESRFIPARRRVLPSPPLLLLFGSHRLFWPHGSPRLFWPVQVPSSDRRWTRR